MSNRTTQKQEKFGYKLRINRTGLAGAQHWEQVGGVFNSSYEALRYKDLRYPNIGKYTITGIRLNVEKVSFSKES